jgi:hypothetical protein
MIVLTDGIDGGSTVTPTAVAQRAADNNIIIYTIGIGSVNPTVLTTIAETTGGAYYSGANFSQLAGIFDRFIDENDLKRDSDEDGISDYHEKKIAAGELTTGSGARVKNFASLNYLNPDSDGDTIRDGDELVIENQNGDIINCERLCIRDIDTGLYGISNSSGEIIVEPTFEKLEMHVFEDNTENLIIVAHQSEQIMFLLDRNGEKHLDMPFESFGLFSEEHGEVFIATSGGFDYQITFEGLSGHGITGETGFFDISSAITRMPFGSFTPEVHIKLINNDLTAINDELIIVKKAVEVFLEVHDDYNSAMHKMIDSKININNFGNYGHIISMSKVSLGHGSFSTNRKKLIDEHGSSAFFYEDFMGTMRYDTEYYKSILLFIEYSNVGNRIMGIDFLMNDKCDWEILGMFRNCGD